MDSQEIERIIRRVCSRWRPVHYYDDLLQECRILVWLRWDRCPADVDRRSWVGQQARHAIQRYQSTLRRRGCEHTGIEDDIAEVNCLTTSDHAIAIADRAYCDWLMGCLLPKQRRVVELYYLEGLTHAEIGRLLGRDEAAICESLRRSRMRMRNLAVGAVVRGRPGRPRKM